MLDSDSKVGCNESLDCVCRLFNNFAQWKCSITSIPKPILLSQVDNSEESGRAFFVWELYT